MKFITNMYRKPSADELAQRELDEAKRSLLDMQAKRDYYSKMVEYYQVRINSLNKQLKDSHDSEGA